MKGYHILLVFPYKNLRMNDKQSHFKSYRFQLLVSGNGNVITKRHCYDSMACHGMVWYGALLNLVHSHPENEKKTNNIETEMNKELG